MPRWMHSNAGGKLYNSLPLIGTSSLVFSDDMSPSLNLPKKDNMLETFLGPGVFSGATPKLPDPNTPHTLGLHRQALQVCNFVVGHLPENPVKVEDVHRAQNTFRLRALLLRSLEEVGEWEDLVEGIEIGINATLSPPPSLSAGSVQPEKVTLDHLLLQVYRIGKSIRDNSNADTQFKRDNPPKNFDGISQQHPQSSEKVLTFLISRFIWMGNTTTNSSPLPNGSPSTSADALAIDTRITPRHNCYDCTRESAGRRPDGNVEGLDQRGNE